MSSSVSLDGHQFLRQRGHNQNKIRNKTTPKSRIFTKNKNRKQNEIDHDKDEDFYREVDQRMSRNSVDYPEEQAQYVNRWVAETRHSMGFLNNNIGNQQQPISPLFSSSSSSSCSSSSSLVSWGSTNPEDWSGNVIGIRGFSGANFPASTTMYPKMKHLSGSRRRKRRKKRYNKLKFDHDRLRDELAKLRKITNSSIEKLKSDLCQKEQEIDWLRNHMLIIKTKYKNDNDGRKDIELKNHIQTLSKRRKAESSSLSLEEGAIEFNDDEELDGVNDKTSFHATRNESLIKQLHSEWHLEREGLLHELAELRAKLEANERIKPTCQEEQAILFIKRDNDRLKAQARADSEELARVKFQFNELESRLNDLMANEQQLGQTKEEQVAKLRLELCRLQVYQPKLEQILESERAIKAELQTRIQQLELERSQVCCELELCQSELIKERTSGRQLESNQLTKMKLECDKWQEKLLRSQRELRDREERVRTLEMKLDQFEARKIDESNTIREDTNRRLGKLSSQLGRCQIEHEKVREYCKQLEQNVDELTRDKESLKNRLQDSQRELEITRGLVERNATQIEQLEANSRRANQLNEQMRDTQLNCQRAMSEREQHKVELESLKRDLAQARQRLLLQQRAHDEFRERKEKELARLRVNLNFEQYQRQIALESIEKELKSSVRELEAMKCRFGSSQKLQKSPVKNNNQKQQLTTTTATTTPTNNTPPSSNTDNNSNHNHQDHVFSSSHKQTNTRDNTTTRCSLLVNDGSNQD